jgi:Heterokaryon incompatibility protein (HET)
MCYIKMADGFVSDPYQLLPLPNDSKSIRILKVHAPSESDRNGGPIRCNFEMIDLESNLEPSYAALTYVWGIKSPAETFSIACGNFTIEITKNCYSALQHLRRNLGAFAIWADAICINQSDSLEKLKQIQLMGKIYSKASTVYVWLGEGDDATDRAMKYLSTSGYLEYFSSGQKSVTDESFKPRAWAAITSVYMENLNLKKSTIPSLRHGLFPSSSNDESTLGTNANFSHR